MKFRVFKISCFRGLLFSTRHLSTHRNETISLRLKTIAICVLVICLLCLPQGCNAPKEVVFTGRTMGTTYHIKVVAGYFKHTAGLQKKIDARLTAINQSMSTYIHDSEISRFNRSTLIEKPFRVGVDFLRVLKVAQHLHTLTGGAWDGTIKPLVDLWGFGSREQGDKLPGAAVINSTLKTVGFHHIHISDHGLIQKKHPLVTLDFGSIAKGYAVDQIALKQTLRHRFRR